MPEPHAIAYRALPELLWETTGEDDYLVFNPLSDEIHRLNPIAAAALAELENQSLTAALLQQRLNSLFDNHEDADFEQQIAQILLQFDEIGLVSPVAPTAVTDGR